MRSRSLRNRVALAGSILLLSLGLFLGFFSFYSFTEVKKRFESSSPNLQTIREDLAFWQKTLFLTSILAAGIAAGGLTFLVYRQLRPLQHLAEITTRLSKGDMTITLPPATGGGELEIIMTSLGKFISTLSQQVRELRAGIEILNSTCMMITDCTTQLATNSQETATSVAETNATSEEMRLTSQTASEKAKQVSATMQRTAETVPVGWHAIEEASQRMASIHEQMEAISESIHILSEQGEAIGEMISVVDDIAEQSNLLAVNAAMEAIKAGEQGKGFGVVAHQIKNMADQSKQATTQVREILKGIQKATSSAVETTIQGSKVVEEGVAQMATTHEAIRMMIECATEAADAAIQIEEATQQQVQGMDQIAAAMGHIRTASSEIADASRDLETAAHDLRQFTARLRDLLSNYHLD